MITHPDRVVLQPFSGLCDSNNGVFGRLHPKRKIRQADPKLHGVRLPKLWIRAILLAKTVANPMTTVAHYAKNL
jgi:hypothetical protein